MESAEGMPQKIDELPAWLGFLPTFEMNEAHEEMEKILGNSSGMANLIKDGDNALISSFNRQSLKFGELKEKQIEDVSPQDPEARKRAEIGERIYLHTILLDGVRKKRHLIRACIENLRQIIAMAQESEVYEIIPILEQEIARIEGGEF